MPLSETLLASLAEQGWAVCDGLQDSRLPGRLYEQCRQVWEHQGFRPAGVGHGGARAVHTGIRGDSICWLEAETAQFAALDFLMWAEDLRRELNRELYAGLHSSEFHFARYPEGRGYKKHMDQHRGQHSRRITLVLYLNPEWTAADGGELCLYAPEDESREVHRVLPLAGRLVLFRSDLIPHEVLPCARTRWSLTGWFRSDAACGHAHAA